MKYADWISLLKKEAHNRGYARDYIRKSGINTWRDYWEDGYSPVEALLHNEKHSGGIQ